MVDMINHPPHYTKGGVECIQAIEAALTEEQFKGFLLGNIIKYLWRSPYKGNMEQDIAKATWYLNRLTEFIMKTEGREIESENESR